MLFLHVTTPSSRMMNTYIKMIRDHFPAEEHRFLFYDRLPNDSKHLLKYGNSVECNGNDKEKIAVMKKHMDEANVIVWHGLMFGAKYSVLPVMYKRYMEKSIWIMRGIDLYNWKNQKTGLKAYVVNKVNRMCREKMPYIGAIFPTDEAVYRKEFGDKAKSFYLPYPMAETAFEMMEDQRNSVPRANGRVYVQVANNAYTFNNHLQILEDLQHFCDEDIRAIIPLSYGNDWYNKEENYISTVQKKAHACLGNKAICLKRLMPPDDYTRLLCNIDISIYRSNRQNALGNILRSLYVGNKVFLTKDNPLFDFFRERDIEIGDADDIREMTYEEFIKMPDGSKAVDWIRRTFHPEANVIYWKQMFDYFKEKSHQQSESAEDSLTPEQEIDAALQRVFPQDAERHSFVRKRNYIDLTRYASLPVGSKLVNIVDVYIIGTNSMAIECFYDKLNVNRRKMRWAFKGFLDDGITTVPDLKHDCDIIGGIYNHAVVPKKYYLNVLEDPAERKKVAELYGEQGAIFVRHNSLGVKIAKNAVMESGTIVLGSTSISSGVTVGKGTILKSSFIENNVRIGSYCTLKKGTWVEKNTIIGDNVVIENDVRIFASTIIKRNVRIDEGAVIGERAIIGVGAHILPYVVVPDNQVIPPYAVVDAPAIGAPEDDTAEDGFSEDASQI